MLPFHGIVCEIIVILETWDQILFAKQNKDRKKNGGMEMSDASMRIISSGSFSVEYE